MPPVRVVVATPPPTVGEKRLGACVFGTLQWHGAVYPGMVDPIPTIEQAMTWAPTDAYHEEEDHPWNVGVTERLVGKISSALQLVSDYHRGGSDFPVSLERAMVFTEELSVRVIISKPSPQRRALQEFIINAVERLCGVKSKFTMKRDTLATWTLSGFCEDVVLACHIFAVLHATVVITRSETKVSHPFPPTLNLILCRKRAAHVLEECTKAIRTYDEAAIDTLDANSSEWSASEKPKRLYEEIVKLDARRRMRSTAAEQHYLISVDSPTRLPEPCSTELELNPFSFATNTILLEARNKVLGDRRKPEVSDEYTKLLYAQLLQEFPSIERAQVEHKVRVYYTYHRAKTDLQEEYEVAQRINNKKAPSRKKAPEVVARPYQWETRWDQYRDALQEEMNCCNSTDDLKTEDDKALPRLPPSLPTPPIDPIDPIDPAIAVPAAKDAVMEDLVVVAKQGSQSARSMEDGDDQLDERTQPPRNEGKRQLGQSSEGSERKKARVVDGKIKEIQKGKGKGRDPDQDS